MFTSWGYSIKQAFSQMGRNKGMYFTSTLAITAMMLILGLFFVAFVNVDLFAETISQDYNVVQIYTEDDNTEAENEKIGKAFEALSGVDEAKYVTKEEALKTLKERWGDNGYLLDNLQSNPLPNSFMIYVEDQDAAAMVADKAEETDGVDDVVYIPLTRLAARVYKRS